MNIIQLKYFLGIIEYKSMNKAAEQLHVSQSTLSVSMTKLEEEMGVKLFRQSGRVLILTEEGKIFHKGVQKLLLDLENLQISVKQCANRLSSIAVVSDAIDFSTESILLFQQKYPKYKFYHYRELNHDIARRILNSGEAAFLITTIKEENSSVCTELLLEEPLYLAISTTSMLTNVSQMSVQDIAKETFITTSAQTANRYLHEHIFCAVGSYPHSIYEVNDPETCLLSVMLNLGLTFLPQCVANSNNRPGSLFPLKDKYCIKSLTNPEAARKVYISYRADRTLSEAEQSFLSFIRSVAAFVEQNKCFPNTVDEMSIQII